MELLAFGNGAIQIGLMVATARLVVAPRRRRMLYAVSGSALACSVAGLLASTGSASGAAVRLPDVAPALTWLLYIGVGVAMVVGIVMATRGQRTRFAWPQGRYQKYRSYRRI